MVGEGADAGASLLDDSAARGGRLRLGRTRPPKRAALEGTQSRRWVGRKNVMLSLFPFPFLFLSLEFSAKHKLSIR